MTRVSIGVRVHAEPERLLATLASIRANTVAVCDVPLLPDGPDEETVRTLFIDV